MLCATTAGIFSFRIWPDGSAPAAVASLVTLRPSGTTNHWTNTAFATFLKFRAPVSSFFCFFLSLVYSSLFYSSLLSDSSDLCLLSLHGAVITTRMRMRVNRLQKRWASSFLSYVIYRYMLNSQRTPPSCFLSTSRCPGFSFATA